MIMKKSIRFPLILSLIVILWMLSGIFYSVEDPSKSNLSDLKKEMTVETTESTSKEIADKIIIQGAIEPLRKIKIRSHTAAHILEIIRKKGSYVNDGDTLFRLATADRSAQFFSAKAKLKSSQIKISQLEMLMPNNSSIESKLQTATNELKSAEIGLNNLALARGIILIKAPFSGVLEDRYIEVGSHVEKGDDLALILDESAVKAVGYVSQQSAGKLLLGQQVEIYLLDGQRAEGQLTYLASSGDDKTHSFKVEVQLDNHDNAIKSGSSAKMHITTGYINAHFLSPATLSLDIEGNIGVKSVTDKGLVAFYSIQILRTEKKGVWVTGLPHEIRIITQGHGFVNEGESVKETPSS
jgi:multidrug efflux system membrane fusion protein